MAKEFIALDEFDTKELRKALALPIFKPLRYMKQSPTGKWQEIVVTHYKIVETYLPSESYSLLVSLKNGEEIRILKDYFGEMQKPSFVDDMNKQSK